MFWQKIWSIGQPPHFAILHTKWKRSWTVTESTAISMMTNAKCCLMRQRTFCNNGRMHNDTGPVQVAGPTSTNNTKTMQKPLLIELFAGSRSVGKIAEQMGWDVWSTDIEPFPGIDHVSDFLNVSYTDMPVWNGRKIVVWASPPCTAFSIASVSHHWEKTPGGALVPKSEGARLGRELSMRTMNLCLRLQSLFGAVFFIENPRGMMRKMWWMQQPHLVRKTVTYCQYGDSRMKPTDIWTNCQAWKPRPMCKNGMPCHESAPRGSKTGTQGLKNNFERSKIPPALCREVLESTTTQTT